MHFEVLKRYLLRRCMNPWQLLSQKYVQKVIPFIFCEVPLPRWAQYSKGKKGNPWIDIFSWLSWLAVLLVGTYTWRWRRQRRRARRRVYSSWQADRIEKSANVVCRQLGELGKKIAKEIQLVFISRKIKHEAKVHKPRPLIVNQQCVVYSYKCDLCDAGYAGHTCRHLH